METGLIWTDLLTDLERIADHCSNISGCVLDPEHPFVNVREGRQSFSQTDSEDRDTYNAMLKKYADWAI